MSSGKRKRESHPSLKSKAKSPQTIKKGIDYFFKKKANGEGNTPTTKYLDDSDIQEIIKENLLDDLDNYENSEDLSRELRERRIQELKDEEFARRIQALVDEGKENESAATSQSCDINFHEANEFDKKITKMDNSQNYFAVDKYLTPDDDPGPFEISEKLGEAAETGLRQNEIINISSPKKQANSKSERSSTTVDIAIDKSILEFDPFVDGKEAELWNTTTSTPYSFLSETFVKVNSTRSRLKIVDYLVNCLRTLIVHDPQSLLPAVWLTTNSLAPPYIPLELNLGPSIISKAIKSSSGVSGQTLKLLYDKYGDIGDVIFESKTSVRTLAQPAPLTIRGVYKSFYQIAQIKGTGSQEIKQRIVERLLVSARGEEARFIGRTLVQNLRIGAVKTTMLIALSRAFTMNAPQGANWTPKNINIMGKEEQDIIFKSAEEIVKQSFARRPSYDEIVPSLLSDGIDGLSQSVGLKIGVPIRPMLGSITRDLSDMSRLLEGHKFTCEFKYDGQRAQIHCDENGKVNIFSRHLETMTTKYPDLVNLVSQIRGDQVKSFIVEGEVVAVDKSGHLQNFQSLTNRARKNVELGAVSQQVCLFAFDLMYLNGQTLLDRPLRERRDLMKSLFVEVPGKFTYVRHMDATSSDQDELAAFFKEAVDAKCEGIMVKVLDIQEESTFAAAAAATTTSTTASITKIGDKNQKGRRKTLPATYEPDKRTAGWCKVKKDYASGSDSLDLVPLGAWHGNGRKAGWWSPILLGVRDPTTGTLRALCKCISGFTDLFYKDLNVRYSLESNKTSNSPKDYIDSPLVPDVWFEPSEVWEIKMADITLSPLYKAAIGLVSEDRGLSIRFPRFIRVREDKSIDECTTEEELAAMYRKQESGRGEDMIEKAVESE